MLTSLLLHAFASLLGIAIMIFGFFVIIGIIGLPSSNRNRRRTIQTLACSLIIIQGTIILDMGLLGLFETLRLPLTALVAVLLAVLFLVLHGRWLISSRNAYDSRLHSDRKD